MKKFYRYLSLFVFAGLSLNSMGQDLGTATVIPIPDDDYFIPEGGCGTELYYVGLKWNTNTSLRLDNSLKATVAIESEDPDVTDEPVDITTYWWDETYGDEEEGNLLILNIQKLVAPSWMNIFGTYTITLPEGLVSDGSATNESQTLTFTVYDSFTIRQRVITPRVSEEWVDEDWNDNPPPTYTADDLKEVTIMWNGVTDLKKYPVTMPVTATSESGMINIEDKVTVLESENKIIIDLSSLSEGIWNINVPQGYVTGNNYGDINTNTSFDIPYIIHGALPPMTEYEVISPDSSDFLTSLDQVKLSFSDQEIIFTNPRDDKEYMSATPVTVSFGGNDYEIYPIIDYTQWNNAFYLVINFLTQVNGANNPCGEYSISIPSGIVKNADGDINGDINLDYVVYKVFTADDSEISITPKEGEVLAADMTAVTISFDDFDEIDINSDVEVRPAIYLVSDNGAPIENDIEPVINGNTMVVPLTGIELTGSLRIEIPQYYIIADSYYLSGAIEITYTIKEEGGSSTGIEGINDYNNSGLYRVYNMQGVKICETTEAAEINTLPKGIYIVNGKKITLQ